MNRQDEGWSLGLLLGMDLFAVYSAHLLAYLIYAQWIGPQPQTFEEFRTLALIPAALTLTAFVFYNVHRCDPGPLGLDKLKRTLAAYFWSASLTLALTFFTKAYDFSRLTIILAIVLGVFFVLAGERMVTLLIRKIEKKRNLKQRVLIIGTGRWAQTLLKNLVLSRRGGAVVGLIRADETDVRQIELRFGEKTLVFPVLGGEDDFARIARELKATETIMAHDRSNPDAHLKIYDETQRLGIPLSVVPSALEMIFVGAEASSIGHIPLFRLGARPHYGISPVIKRTVDIMGAALLAVLSFPFWLAAAIAIRLETPGPALFTHERVGKNGNRFRMYKFRSMHVNADPYALTPANTRDSRITRVGAFIRRSSIDELPQLINVLKGDMSLVGPRPEMPFIVDEYDEFQRMRLTAKPGLTGVWQISADRANPIHENLDYDFYYLKNQSLWLDLAILIKTITSTARGLGAY